MCFYMFKQQNRAIYEVYPDDPVIVFKNGGFGLNIGNPKVSKNILKNLRKIAKLQVASKNTLSNKTDR